MIKIEIVNRTIPKYCLAINLSLNKALKTNAVKKAAKDNILAITAKFTCAYYTETITM